MSNSVTFTQTFSGLGPTAVGGSEVVTGGAGVTLNGAAGNGTTTLATQVIENLATQVAIYAAQADGNCTIIIDGASSATTDGTITLTANTPKIVRGNGTLCGDMPVGADTYTFKVLNASTVSINVDIRLLIS